MVNIEKLWLYVKQLFYFMYHSLMKISNNLESKTPKTLIEEFS